MNLVSEPERLVPAPPPRRRRWASWLTLGGAVVLLLGLLLASVVGLFLYQDAGERRLSEALAEIDRVDPGWRIDDVEGQRAAVPDDENAALIVIDVHELLPKRIWPQAPEQLPHPQTDGENAPRNRGEPDLAQEWPNALPPGNAQDGKSVDVKIDALPPYRLLFADLFEELCDALDEVNAALVEARKLKDFPRGRYPIAYAPDGISTLLPHAQKPRAIVRMLQLEAIRLSQEGQADEALDTARAAMNAGRSLGDEPLAISQLVHIACAHVAIEIMSRTLALGEPSADALELMQALLELDASEPTFLISMRGDRALMHQAFLALESGRLGVSAVSAFPGKGTPSPLDYAYRANLKHDHAWYLRYMTKVVETAKQPPEEWDAPLQKYEKEAATAPPVSRLLIPAILKLAQASRRHLALTRCAIVAVAMERYRWRHDGQWPASLEALIEDRLLAEVPLDPFTGKPLKLVRRPGHRVIYSVGPNKLDDAGAAYPWNRLSESPGDASDIGFILWDDHHRRQPPAEILHKPWEAGDEPEKE